MCTDLTFFIDNHDVADVWWHSRSFICGIINLILHKIHLQYFEHQWVNAQLNVESHFNNEIHWLSMKCLKKQNQDFQWNNNFWANVFEVDWRWGNYNIFDGELYLLNYFSDKNDHVSLFECISHHWKAHQNGVKFEFPLLNCTTSIEKSTNFN